MLPLFAGLMAVTDEWDCKKILIILGWLMLQLGEALLRVVR